MGFMDKFMSAMNLDKGTFDSYNDDYDEDFYDDDDVDDVPKKTFFKDHAEKDDTDDMRFRKPVSKVTPIRSAKKSTNGMEVCIIKPTSMEDTQEITDTLKANRAVVLNLEGLDVEIGQRIVDYTSGSVYALEGKLQKISNYILVATPATVGISGDFQEILSGTFDVPNVTM